MYLCEQNLGRPLTVAEYGAKLRSDATYTILAGTGLVFLIFFLPPVIGLWSLLIGLCVYFYGLKKSASVNRLVIMYSRDLTTKQLRQRLEESNIRHCCLEELERQIDELETELKVKSDRSSTE